MENVTSQQKKSLRNKLLEFQKKGYIAYGKDLDRQLKAAGVSNLKKAYRAYLVKEIAKNKERIAKIDAKLK